MTLVIGVCQLTGQAESMRPTPFVMPDFNRVFERLVGFIHLGTTEGTAVSSLLSV